MVFLYFILHMTPCIKRLLTSMYLTCLKYKICVVMGDDNIRPYHTCLTCGINETN